MTDVAKEYTVEDIQKQVKPLSENAFVRFWQKIWRWWLGAWYGFCDKHPKISKLLQMAFFFIVFSEGVTIWQYIVMTFLPFLFEGLWSVSFVWPAVALPWQDAVGNTLNYAIFNEPVKFLINMQGEDGAWSVVTVLASTPEQVEMYIDYTYQNVSNGQLVGPELSSLQCAGLGNFIAFEIAVFTAQCINFPLQRNITYRSHGNPYYQAMWYFIGWVFVSIGVNAIWGIINPMLMWWNWPEALIGLIKTVLTGGVSMVIFFFIFMVIFPDNNKMVKNAQAKYEKLVAANAPAEAIAAAEAKMKLWEVKAIKSNTESEYAKAKSQVNAAAMRYNAIVKASQNPNNTEEENAAYVQKVEAAFNEAINAIKLKDEKEIAFNEAAAL